MLAGLPLFNQLSVLKSLLLLFTQKQFSMKKLITAAAIILVSFSACNNDSTKEGATTDKPAESKEATTAKDREKEINDSTKLLDKKLADPNSKYSPDSLK